MSLAHAWILLLIPLACAAVVWAAARSRHPMPAGRRRALTSVRCAVIALVLAALAGPWLPGGSTGRAVVLVLDASRSLGDAGWTAACARASAIVTSLPAGTEVAAVATGGSAVVVQDARRGLDLPAAPPAGLDRDATDYGAGIDLARGLFPPGTARQIVVIGDGQENRGDGTTAARTARLDAATVHAAPVAGPAVADARLVRLRPSRTRAHEGAAIDLNAEIDSTLSGSGTIRLFENGVEVASQPLTLVAGQSIAVPFHRVPAERNLYTWRAVLDGFAGDAIPADDAAVALVDVGGRPRVLHLATDAAEARHLADALDQEGIRCDTRKPGEAPRSAAELAAWDAVILADTPARDLPDASMAALTDYVQDLGGGVVAIGGTASFGVGGWYRTPLEDLLPVTLQSPDTEERAATALCLVIDKSGSMSGDKIEMVKSAATATTALLAPKDWIGVIAFDSSAAWVVPMQRLTSRATVDGLISTIQAGGGTNIFPGMAEARQALNRAPAKVRHMIVLTDGQTNGSGYAELAAACRAERITISTVGVGDGADTNLLQAIAAAGGGKYHFADNPASLPKIFTQDAMTHLGRLLREQAFQPRAVERHPMLEGVDPKAMPQLLGYVRTQRRTTAQVPLVTDLGEPLLAHWRFGLGKVTAFTSDCTPRWSALWLARWPKGYVQFWAQVVRETAREPQGRRLDLRLEPTGATVGIQADVLEDAATFRNDAAVEAQVWHIASGGGTATETGPPMALEQDGPGRYRGSFKPGRPGVYLVRARLGADQVSAAIVHDSTAEAAGGRIDRDRLSRLVTAGGGTVLAADAALPAPPAAAHGAGTDLAPWLVVAALLLFCADIVLRRWENCLGVWERLTGR